MSDLPDLMMLTGKLVIVAIVVISVGWPVSPASSRPILIAAAELVCWSIIFLVFFDFTLS